MKNLKANLKEKIENVYLISGEDSALAEKGLIMIKDAVKPTPEDFNMAEFNDENFSAKVVIDSCNNLPIGECNRLVVVKNIFKLNESDKRQLLLYCDNPSQSTTLVIIDYLNVFDFLKGHSKFVDARRFSPDMLVKIVASTVKTFGKNISEQAARELIERCNYYYGNIMNEINKLAYYSDENMITKEMVESVTNKEVEFAIYELTDALGKKNGSKAINLLHLMEKDVGTYALMANHFRRLFFVSISEGTNQQLAKELGVKEFAVIKAKENAKNFSKLQLKKIFELIEEVDFLNKSGKMDAGIALYYLAFNILNI